MCDWNDTIPLRVPIPAKLSRTRKATWATKHIDRCIAPIVQALNAGGVLTAGACCGHGKRRGTILLHDGRTLIIAKRMACSMDPFSTANPNNAPHLDR